MELGHLRLPPVLASAMLAVALAKQLDGLWQAGIGRKPTKLATKIQPPSTYTHLYH